MAEHNTDPELLEILETGKRRGGVRPNSGRPTLAPDQRPWRLSIGLKRQNRNDLKTMAVKRGVSMARMLNILIEKQAEEDKRQEEIEQGLPKSDSGDPENVALV